jgi:hypothetical protein
MAAQSPAPRPSASPTPDYWVDATARTIGTTAEWSNKVELADLDADDDVDILFANGGLYESAGPPSPGSSRSAMSTATAWSIS